MPPFPGSPLDDFDTLFVRKLIGCVENSKLFKLAFLSATTIRDDRPKTPFSFAQSTKRVRLHAKLNLVDISIYELSQLSSQLGRQPGRQPGSQVGQAGPTKQPAGLSGDAAGLRAGPVPHGGARRAGPSGSLRRAFRGNLRSLDFVGFSSGIIRTSLYGLRSEQQRTTNTWHSPKRPPFCAKLCYYVLNHSKIVPGRVLQYADIF